ADSRQNESQLLPHVVETGSIAEYTPVGDGAHLPQHQLSLLPLIERTRPRPHSLVRKVTVVGSHVLRYVSRNSSLFMRRHLRPNFQSTQGNRIDRQINYGNASDNDLEGIDWTLNNNRQFAGMPSMLQFPLEPGSQHRMLESNVVESSFWGLLNWKIYIGMICIFVAQALLKLSFQEMYNI
ncbi:hypothetical protein KR044_006892, partial [Drosophila immigrans]